MKILWLVCIAALSLVAGCSAFDSSGPGPDASSLMSLWKRYEHCVQSGDPFIMWVDSQRLQLAVSRMEKQQPVSFVPDPAQHLFAELPSRLSVDPKAMAADCALKGGEAAHAQGRWMLAGALFRQAADTVPVERYRFYVREAERKLEILEERLG